MAQTNRQKIAVLSAQVAEKQLEIARLSVLAENEVDTNSIAAGDKIVVTYGRGDKAKEVQAEVLGVKREAGKAALFKVLIGEGFDAEQGIVFESAIKSIVKPEVADEAPEEGPAVDPLAGDEPTV